MALFPMASDEKISEIRALASKHTSEKHSKIAHRKRCERFLTWSGRRDSDPRISAWKADALPLGDSRKRNALYSVPKMVSSSIFEMISLPRFKDMFYCI